MNQREMLRNLIKATNGLFFSITFKTKKNETRHLTMKDGVSSRLVYPKGQGSNRQEHCENLITLFDVVTGHYKSVNLDTVTKLKCSNKIRWEEKGE